MLLPGGGGGGWGNCMSDPPLLKASSIQMLAPHYVIMWMDEILHHPRNPGCRFSCKYQQTLWFQPWFQFLRNLCQLVRRHGRGEGLGEGEDRVHRGLELRPSAAVLTRRIAARRRGFAGSAAAFRQGALRLENFLPIKMGFSELSH